MMRHPKTVMLHDYLDDELSGDERTTVEAHVAACAPCRERLAGLAEVRTGLDGLPRVGRPGRDLWPGIRQRIADGPDVVALPVTPVRQAAVLPGDGRDVGAPATGAVLWRRRVSLPLPLALAAGLVLAFVSGALTWQAVRPVTPGSAAAVLTAPDAAPLRGRQAATGAYDEAIADLEAFLARGRVRLDPVTVQTLEESLATIDAAIADARAALASDPGSALLQDMLLAQQRTKYRVLSRATAQLVPRT